MSPFRAVLAVATSAAAAALGALLLGEYSISGLVGLGAGLVFGLLVGEVAVSVARSGSTVLAGVVGAAAGGGMLWAAWISTGADLARLAPEGWVAVVLAAITGAIRARPPRRAPHNPAAPAPGP